MILIENQVIRRVYMTNKCCVCEANDVDSPGGICECCLTIQDPYITELAKSKGAEKAPDVSLNNGQIKNPSVSRKGSTRKILLGGGRSIANCDPYGNDLTMEPESEPSVQILPTGQVPNMQSNASAST